MSKQFSIQTAVWVCDVHVQFQMNNVDQVTPAPKLKLHAVKAILASDCGGMNMESTDFKLGVNNKIIHLPKLINSTGKVLKFDLLVFHISCSQENFNCPYLDSNRSMSGMIHVIFIGNILKLGPNRVFPFYTISRETLQCQEK